jgi:hypothetical protein
MAKRLKLRDIVGISSSKFYKLLSLTLAKIAKSLKILISTLQLHERPVVFYFQLSKLSI